MSGSADFGRRHPRLTGALGLPIWLLGTALALSFLLGGEVESGGLLVALGSASGGAMGLLMVSGAPRKASWARRLLLAYAVVLLALSGRHGTAPPFGAALGASALLSGGVCLTVGSVALLCGVRRPVVGGR